MSPTRKFWRIWQEADGIPALEHAWLFDHFSPINGHLDGPCLEGWQTLGALAAATNRLRLGLMVTGNTYRHPAVLTKIAITTDIISKGRLDFGIGAGWNEYEHTSMGLSLYQPGERIRRLNEACEIYKSLCTEHLTTYEGRYYQLKDARSEPKPVQKPYPPIVIGGSGEQLTLRVVAKHADIWNATAQSTEIFQHKVSVLREHCAAIGRDPEEIEYSVQIPVNYDDMDATVQTCAAVRRCRRDAPDSQPAPALPGPHRRPPRGRDDPEGHAAGIAGFVARAFRPTLAHTERVCRSGFVDTNRAAPYTYVARFPAEAGSILHCVTRAPCGTYVVRGGVFVHTFQGGHEWSSGHGNRSASRASESMASASGWRPRMVAGCLQRAVAGGARS